MIQQKRPSSRRQLFKQLLTVGAAVAAPMINRNRYRLFAASPQDYSARAIELVGRSTVIDMLSPLTLDFAKSRRWLQDPSLFGTVDFADFKASGIHPFTSESDWEERMPIAPLCSSSEAGTVSSRTAKITSFESTASRIWSGPKRPPEPGSCSACKTPLTSEGPPTSPSSMVSGSGSHNSPITRAT